MVITYKHSGGDTVICHGTGHRGEVGFFTGPVGGEDTAVAEWSAQVSRPIRASSAKPLDRGNGLFSFDFSVERRFGTEDDALAWKLTFPASLPRFGARLEVGDIGGVVMELPDAALERLTINRVGLSCDVTFEFKTAMPEVKE